MTVKAAARDVLTRAAGNVVAQLVLFALVAAAPLLGAWFNARVARAVLSPVPAYWIWVALFAGAAVVLCVWAIVRRRGSPLTDDERRLLVLLQKAGDRGVYFEATQKGMGLSPPGFDLLVHRLSSRRLIYDHRLDTRIYEEGEPPERRQLVIRGEGKTLLVKLAPRALDDGAPLPDGVRVRERKKKADWTAY